MVLELALALVVVIAVLAFIQVVYLGSGVSKVLSTVGT
jgi:hypothetical protein